MSVFIQKDNFDISLELSKLSFNDEIGAVVTFTGLVRSGSNKSVQALELDCYPEMAEKALLDIEKKAHKRWVLFNSLIIHRYGFLKLGEQIMMVATASKHRKDAFEAAEYMMDFLKMDAPFWKKEHTDIGSYWLDASKNDKVELIRWNDEKS